MGMKLFEGLSRISFLFAAVFAFGASLFAGVEEHDALLAVAKDKEADFESALAKAIENGMAEDFVLEAEIVRTLSTGNVEAMFDLVPRIDAVGEDFRYGVGRDFFSAKQLAGFADTLRCVIAFKEGDMEGFEKFAVESFAKAPDFNGAFGIGELLARQRMTEAAESAMSDFRVPMDMELANTDGESKTLAEWMGDDKAMLVDFWASWCGPCIRLMPKLKEKQASLSAQGIFVAGINTDRNDQLNNALKIRDREGMESVPWLLDRNGGDLSGMLMIDSIPRMVLIDREGTVLYNGHPVDPALGVALSKLGVELH
ncbi:antioxidant, AhpC/TSA family [Verrucomicrobiia bacterium DG1235]|nr:antioxidant, AhpC/TSA family [Verrucomicrobiae bacterium DG1235]